MIYFQFAAAFPNTSKNDGRMQKKKGGKDRGKVPEEENPKKTYTRKWRRRGVLLSSSCVVYTV